MKVSILTSTYRGLSAQTHMSVINAMSILGWPHRTVSDDAVIDHARGMLVSDWYRQTDDDAFVMVDDDILFFPHDLLKLSKRLSSTEVVSATYPARLGQTLTGVPLDPGMDATCLEDDKLIELDRAGLGCLAVKRSAIERLVEEVDECYAENGQTFWPLFLPFVRDGRYVGEDMAFCWRLRRANARIWLDPTVRVAHMSRELPVTMANMEQVRQAVEIYQRSLAGENLIAA